jgi:beta-glucosidase
LLHKSYPNYPYYVKISRRSSRIVPIGLSEKAPIALLDKLGMLLPALFLRSLSQFPSDAEIEKLLSRLTLEEKVGQMAQFGVDDLADGVTATVDLDWAIKTVNVYKIGSSQTHQSHTRAGWSRIVSTQQQLADQNPSRIPLLCILNTIHGANFVENATLFPQQIALAATFDPDLATLVGTVAAYESRAASIPLTHTPVLDLGGDVRWPRLWETFGEDPYVCGVMGAASVRGFQGSDPRSIDAQHIGACAKHFIGYGVPITGHDRTPAVISENYLREYHLPPFKAAIDAGVLGVMINSGTVNALPVHASRYLITDLLKGELGFDGYVITDWADIENFYTRDHIATSSKDAVRIGINAGLDMSLVPGNVKYFDWLIELVREGQIAVSRIDDAVRRILRAKARLGLFKTPATRPEDYPKFGSQEFENASYKCAAEAITLLKNDGTLPIPEAAGVLVCGPNADSLRALQGAWTFTWQGRLVSEHLAASKYNTIQKAIGRVAQHAQFLAGVRYNDSARYDQSFEDPVCGIGCVRDAARAANVSHVVVAIGENSYAEYEGNTYDLNLDGLQLQLIEELIATGKKVILVINAGRPRIIEPVVDRVAGIVMAYLPGSFGAEAIADVLFGRVNPSGKLPFTWPRYPHSIMTYYHKLSEEITPMGPDVPPGEADWNPQWEFGFGLSYTRFNYTKLVLSRTTFSANQTLTVSVGIENKGARAGKEVVLVFVSDHYASVAPDKKRLRAFRKVAFLPGEAKTVDFELTAKDLSFINAENKRVTEPGEFTVSVGPLRHDFTFQ